MRETGCPLETDGYSCLGAFTDSGGYTRRRSLIICGIAFTRQREASSIVAAFRSGRWWVAP